MSEHRLYGHRSDGGLHRVNCVCGLEFGHPMVEEAACKARECKAFDALGEHIAFRISEGEIRRGRVTRAAARRGPRAGRGS